jgi:hypothetical protein
MLTYGFLGMVAGDPYWFAGTGDGFKDWDGGANDPDSAKYCHGQSGAKLCDLDGDGDADFISREGLFLNDGKGHFSPCRDQAQESRYNDRKAFGELCQKMGALYLDVWFEDTFDFHLVDLSNGAYKDILLLGEEACFFGLARGKTDWEFFVLPGHHAVALDATNPKSPQLVFLTPPKKELAEFLSRERLRHRVTHAALPKVTDSLLRGKSGTEYHWLDMDGDGLGELVLCLGKIVGGGPFRPVVQWEIHIGREAEKQYELLGRFIAGPDRCISPMCISFRPPFAVNQFVDFDRDGDLDLLSPDHCIYRQDKGFAFTKAVEIDLPCEGRFPARFFVHDVNADGWPDVVSSLHPFWNVKFGPLMK